jgi:hypothetical protein
VCHSANTTIANVGRPPILDVGVGRGEFDARIMPIGEQMQHVFGKCLRESQEHRTRLSIETCGIYMSRTVSSSSCRISHLKLRKSVFQYSQCVFLQPQKQF